MSVLGAQLSDVTAYPFVQGFDDLWHVRTRGEPVDTVYEVVCGRVHSVHVSSFPPVLMDGAASDKRHCRTCFPVGRVSRAKGWREHVASYERPT